MILCRPLSAEIVDFISNYLGYSESDLEYEDIQHMVDAVERKILNWQNENA